MTETNEHQLALEHRELVEPLWTEVVFNACDPVAAMSDTSSILLAESRCGYVAERLQSTLPSDARVMVLDPSRAMLDQARTRFSTDSTSKMFFIPQRVTKLSYADDVFRSSICLNGMVTAEETAKAIEELARVTAPGGSVIAALPMQGSFPEFYDILDEAFRAHQLHDVLGRMYKLQRSFVSSGQLFDIAQDAGLYEPTIHELSWDVSFDSRYAMLHSPLVRETFFPHWMRIIRSSDREPILRYVMDAIDTYWHNREFKCKIVAACLTALR